MKMFVYSLREYDERAFFDGMTAKYGVEYSSTGEKPTLENADLAKGYDAVNILTSPVDAALIDRFWDLGVRCIATRTIGYNHIDHVYARNVGMGVVNIAYSPATVADYTVMMILIGLRKLKYIQLRAGLQDFSLEGKLGRELRSCTVGIIGTGRIGSCVAHELKGFGCRIIAYDPYEKEELKDTVEYCSLDTLLKESDVITLHAASENGGAHMIGREAFAEMKDGVGIVNCARGSLIDSQALIDNIKSSHVGFACLDTVENEYDLYYFNRMGQPLDNPYLAELKSFPNVLVTPHMAFYTDQAVSDMVEHSITGILEFFEKQQ